MLNKESAIKRVTEIIEAWLCDELGKMGSLHCSEIVDAVIGEMFGWKAKSSEGCEECLFYNVVEDPREEYSEKNEHMCLFGTIDCFDSLSDLWPTCPKPKRPKKGGGVPNVKIKAEIYFLLPENADLSKKNAISFVEDAVVGFTQIVEAGTMVKTQYEISEVDEVAP
jgi:hypothetical protein